MVKKTSQAHVSFLLEDIRFAWFINILQLSIEHSFLSISHHSLYSVIIVIFISSPVSVAVMCSDN